MGLPARQLPKPQTGLERVDRHLALVSDTLNPLLRSLGAVGPREALEPLTVAVPTNVVPLTLANGWADYGGNGPVPAYSVDTLGECSLRGDVKGGAFGAACATLPAAIAPAAEYQFSCASWTGAAYVLGAAVVQANGNILIQQGNNAFFSLAGIRFPISGALPVPSCWPLEVPHTLGTVPLAVVVGACVDMANPIANLPWPQLSVQWVPSTVIPHGISIRNIPGLLPGHRYNLQLLAFA